MLNGQLDELGNAFLRNRALDEQKRQGDERIDIEKKRIGVDQSFRDAQLQHYKNMETTAAGTAAKQLDQAALAEKQKLLQTAITLNATGALADGALENVNNWLSTDEQLGQSGLQLRPPANPLGKGKDAAVVNALKQADAYDQLADGEENPEKAAGFKTNAKQLRDWVGRQASFAPAQGYQTTTEKPELDEFGKPTGKMLTSTSRKVPLPGTPPAVAAAPAAPKAAVSNQMVQVIRPDGQTGMIPRANLPGALAAGYKQVGTNAPTVAVPGFGNAQP